MSRLQVQAGPGRPGRQGSLQSLFWFPGRNKARSNVLWRARTSTGPPGGGGGGGGVVTVTSDDTSCLPPRCSGGGRGRGWVTTVATGPTRGWLEVSCQSH